MEIRKQEIEDCFPQIILSTELNLVVNEIDKKNKVLFEGYNPEKELQLLLKNLLNVSVSDEKKFNLELIKICLRFPEFPGFATYTLDILKCCHQIGSEEIMKIVLKMFGLPPRINLLKEVEEFKKLLKPNDSQELQTNELMEEKKAEIGSYEKFGSIITEVYDNRDLYKIFKDKLGGKMNDKKTASNDSNLTTLNKNCNLV